MIGYLIDQLLTLIGFFTAYECPLCLREYAEWRPDEVCPSCARALRKLDADRELVARVRAARSARDSSSSDSSDRRM